MADVLGGVRTLQCGRVLCRHLPLLVSFLLYWKGNPACTADSVQPGSKYDLDFNEASRSLNKINSDDRSVLSQGFVSSFAWITNMGDW